VLGNLFNRSMALEGQRRARLVAPFEIDRYREFGAFVPAQEKN